MVSETSFNESIDIITRPNRRVGVLFLVALLICLITIGNGYCYDQPQALQDVIISNMKISYVRYGVINSVYSLPNIIFVIFGGLLIDKYLGIRLSAILFNSLMLIGQLLFATAAYIQNFYIMIIGRFIFGLGAEATFICVNTYFAIWFSKSMLVLVTAIGFSFVKGSQILNLMLSHKFYEYLHSLYPCLETHKILAIVLSFGLIGVLISLLASIVLGLLDYSLREDQVTRVNKSSFFGRKYTPVFWTLTAICLSAYGSLFCFNSFVIDFFQTKYEISPIGSLTLISYGSVISIFLMPTIGIVCSFFGRECYILMLSLAVSIVVHCFFAVSYISPGFIKVTGDIAISVMACVLWPIVCSTVNKKDLGAAIGIMMSIQNIGLGLVPILSGFLIQKIGYLCFESMTLILAWIAFILSIAVTYCSKTRRSSFLGQI